MSPATQDKVLAYGLLRLILGLNIAIHGLSRLGSGSSAFAAGLVPLFAHTPLPAWAVYGFAIALPWAEALVGLCVLVGVATRWAYLLGMLVLAALTFGTTLRQDWETASLQLTYALVYAILLFTREYNNLSIDGLRARASR